MPKATSAKGVVEGPKKPLTAYMIFVSENRERVKDERQGVGSAPKDIMTALGEKWKMLSDAQKKPYEEKADADRIRYLSEGGKPSKAAAKKERELSGAPKRVNPYIIFSSENRDEIKKAYPELTNKDLVAKIGELWGALPESEKQKYKDKAAAARVDGKTEAL